MPKVAYSEEERERVRTALLTKGLELMAKQGIQHTTVEQIYKAVGISRTFFYSFFPTKEDFILEMLYLQQPKVVAYATWLMNNPRLIWREAVEQFFRSCCYGEENGIAVMTIEEQQHLFSKLSEESRRTFRDRQARLFSDILSAFGIRPDAKRVRLMTNLSLSVILFRRAVPETLPFLVPEAIDETVGIQINGIVDFLDSLRDEDMPLPL